VVVDLGNQLEQTINAEISRWNILLLAQRATNRGKLRHYDPTSAPATRGQYLQITSCDVDSWKQLRLRTLQAS